MKNITEKIKNILENEVIAVDDDNRLFLEAEATVGRIFDKSSAEDKVSFVRAFMADETGKRKLLSYCEKFDDPTVRKEVNSQGEQIMLHYYFDEDDFERLYNFVKKHKEDVPFGTMVETIMSKHNLKASEVYKSACLSKQDFSRVTDYRCKNVTRRIVWQIIIGLKCSLEEADLVLYSAGYTRRKTALDLTMEYFITNKVYDISTIDEVLTELEIPNLVRVREEYPSICLLTHGISAHRYFGYGLLVYACIL